MSKPDWQDARDAELRGAAQTTQQYVGAQQYPSPQDQLHTGQERRKPQQSNLERKVDYLINLVHNLGARVMAQDATIDDLVTEVTAQTTQDESVKTMIVGLRTMLNDVLSGTQLPPAAQQKINDVLSLLQANSAALADAIAAGGPPAGTSVP